MIVTRLVSIIVAGGSVSFFADLARRPTRRLKEQTTRPTASYRFDEPRRVDAKPDTSTHPRPGYRLNWSEAPLRCLNRNLVALKKANNLKSASFISTVHVPRLATSLGDLSVRGNKIKVDK